MICNPAANPPIPRGLRVLTDAEITAAIQAEAQRISDDGSIPIGDLSRRGWYAVRTGGQLPLVFAVLCHDRHAGESGPTGAYHGVTVFVATDPAWYPERATDWKLVAVGTGLIAGTVTLFLLAIKHAGRADALRHAAEPRRLRGRRAAHA